MAAAGVLTTDEMESPSATPFAGVDEAIGALQDHAEQLAGLKLPARRELTEACADAVADVARDWVEAACEAKRIPPASNARAEEITAGPVATIRYLRLFAQTLSDIERSGLPRLPGPVREDRGQLRAVVFPTQHLYDRLLFRPMSAETWLEPGVGREHMFGTNIERLTGASREEGHVACVLGAGNVSSIPATDALTKVLQENRPVLLKMNPVNGYLGPLLERGLAPLVKAGFLRIVYGGADAGKYAVEHAGIGEVHVTGSVDTHDAIVWGGDSGERERRRAAGDLVLHKPITSELGNVTPWIVAPGLYSDAELRFQAESIAASIVNNASFNCIATKVIVTCRTWPQRDVFLDLVESHLRAVPHRYAYYPGASDRFVEFGGRSPDDPQHLPWALLRGANIDESPHLFARESFVCVCAETPLAADTPETFLSRAADFVNDRVWGTLAAAVTVPRNFQKRHPAALDEALRELRYGTIGINQWPGVAYALMSPPWGGHPGTNLADVQSGIGFVHNTYLLDRPQKTVLHCPLKFSPKPVWFPSHRNAEAVAWKLLELYRKPSVLRLPNLLIQALRA